MLQHGIDLHKRSLTIATVDSTGHLVKQKRLPTDRSALMRYLEVLPGPHRAVVEATGSWYWLAELFASHGVELKLAHARQLKAITQAKVKTDAVDSLTLAQLLRADLIPEAHMLEGELRGYRDLLRARLRLVGRRTAAKCVIESLLERYNQPTPEELPPLARFEAGLHQDQISVLTHQIKEIERLLNPVLLPELEVQRLLWIPGIGRQAAFTIYLEVGDIQRFPSDRQFCSYCRLVPGAKNSGGSRRHARSKEGNRYLKSAFRNAGVRAVQYEPTVKAWYQKKLRAKGKPIAQALVAKEIARIAYQVLKDDVDFNGTFKGVPIQHMKSVAWPRRASPDA
jgi:transposase